MSGVTPVTNMGAQDRTPSVLKSPSLLRARHSVADVAVRTAEASERALADYAALVARLEAENAALRGEVAQLQAQSAEAAAASGAALQAQSTTIESQAATIQSQTVINTALSEELAEAKSRIARLVATAEATCALLHSSPGSSYLRDAASRMLTANFKE